MNSKLIRPLVSCLLIIALLVPAVAQAMPAAPASPQTWPAETLRDYAVPAWPQSTGANDADSGSSVDSAALNEPVGRLLLSPAIDADGDPLTNPVGSAPVARFGGAQPDPANDVLYAVIGLAAEVIPDDRQHNPAGIMVSFRIWHETSPVELVKEARSDAWGAAAVEQIFDDLHLTGRWFYQASASGYGETPVRSFGFDTSSYSDDTRLGAARLTTQIEADGRLVVEIESDVPSSESMLAVELLAVQLIPTSDELAPPERKVLPPMVARRLDDYRSRAELFLEGGNYLLMAMVHSGPVTAQSQPELVTVPVAAPPPIATVEAIYDPSPDGETWLVQYRTPEGDIALLRRHVNDLPPPAYAEEAPVFRENRRTGAFRWEQDTYTIKTDVLIDDGRKMARLDGVSYDPIARQFDIEIGSLMDEPVEDKLTVQVFGPGGVIIHEETVPILLDPSGPLHYSVVMSTDLGEPQAVRIIIHDPAVFDMLIDRTAAAVNSLWQLLDSLLPDGSDLTLGFKTGLNIVSIDLISYSILCGVRAGCSSNKGGIWYAKSLEDAFLIIYVGVRNYLRNTFYLDSPEKALENLMAGLELGGGSITVTAGGRYTRTLFNPSQCQDKAAADAAKNYVRILGGNLQNTAARINQRFKEVRETLQGAPRPTVPFPGVWFLGFRFAPILTFNVDAGPSGDYAVYGGMEGELGGQVVLVLDALSYFDALVNLKDYRHLAYGFYTGIETLETVAEMFATIGSADTAANKARKCRPPNPNGDPDDRRDAYQTDVLLEPTGASGGVVHYQQQLATAQRLGLTRAETYWTFKLRQAELAMFSLDPIEKSNDILEREALYYETRLTIQGLISGAIPLEPGQTITDTVRAAYDDFVVGAASTTTLQRHQTLQDALDFAQRQYSALHGQELALQQELRTQLAQAGIGVMDSGLSFWTLTALGTLGIEGQLVEILPGSGSRLYSSRYLSPFAAPSVLVVPSGGLFRYGDSQQARAWLDTYVNLGGTLIVLAQANSEDWNLLPGGEVEGLGYEQDILCKTASVRIVNSSSWIKGIGRDLPDIQIDGSFTAWPADATIVLLRTTGNQLPAMIEYDYGAGHVVAMSAYPDFYINGMQSVEDIVFARSLFGLAYLRATGQTVAGVAAAPGAAVTLPVPVHNNMSVAARELTLMRDYYNGYIGQSWRWSAHRPRPLQGTTVASLNPNLASGAGSTIPVTFAAPPQAGIFRTGLFLAGPYQAGATYSNWSRSGSILGPFYEVQSTYTAPPGLSVRSNQDRYAFGEPAEITVVVHNNQPLARTFELRPLAGLEAPPVVLPVGPNGNAQHVFTTRVYGRSTLRIGLAENDVLLSEAPLVLRLSPPFLGLETAAERLPAGLATNMVVTATLVDGRASQVDWEARSSTGALVDSATTLLTPSSAYSVTTASLSLPTAAAGDQVTINARLVGATGAMTQTLPVLPPYWLAGASLSGPLVIANGNAGSVHTRVDDSGFTGGGQMRALLQRNGDSAVVAAGPWQAIALGGGSQEISLDLPLPASLDASQSYSVVIDATGQVVGGDPINASRVLPLPAIDLDIVLLSAQRAVRQPLALRVFSPQGRVRILPAAPFTVTLTAEEGPPWSVSTVVTQAVGIESLLLEMSTPSAPRGGRFQVTVQSPSLLNWQASDHLSIPAHQLHYSAPAALVAGQPLVWTASNSGGVDTTLDGNLVLLDDDGVKVAQAQVSGAIQIGTVLTVTLDAPQQLRSGAYRLRWSGVDHLSLPVRDDRVVAVAGLDVELASQTDQPAYLSGQTVTALSAITSSAALEDAQLRLRVTSRGGNPYVGDYGEPGVIATTVVGGLRDGAAAGRALRLDRLATVSFFPNGDYALLGDGRVIQQVDTVSWAGQVVAGRSGIGNSAVDGVGLNARFAADLMSVSLSGDGSFAILVEFGRGVIRRYDTATGAVSFVAGGGGNCADGVGTAARFHFPGQSAVSHDGSFALVTDACGLRHIDLATGNVTTLVPGLTGGVAIAPGDAYALVAFPNAHTVNLVTLPGGANAVLAGASFSSGSADGLGAVARFNSPGAVAISDDGTFALVADTGNHTVRRIGLPGAAVTTLAGAVGQAGFVDGVGSAARFADLYSVAISPDNSYALLADRDNQAVRRLDLASNAVTTALGNWPGADGLANAARFDYPTDVAVSADGSFALVADNGNATLRRFDLTDGQVTTIAGVYKQHDTVDGVGAGARFYFPAGVAISPDATQALVVDDAHHVVRQVDLATLEVTTLAGSANASGFVDGVGNAARFYYPQDVVYSPDGNYALIADVSNDAIRKLDLATGEVSTFVTPGTAGMDDPRAIDFSSDGSFILVASTTDYVVYRVDISGGAATAVTVLAGSGVRGVVDGVGAAAGFDWPEGIAISPDGSTALVSERFPHVMRRIDLATAEVTTVAGAVWEDSTMRDGPGAAARIYEPQGVDFGPDGGWALTAITLGNAIARLDLTTLPKAQVQTVINRPPDSDGEGPAARLYYPSAIALSSGGTFAVIADSGNNAIRFLDLTSPERAAEVARLAGAGNSPAQSTAPVRRPDRGRDRPIEEAAYPALHLLSRGGPAEQTDNPAARPQPRRPERPTPTNVAPTAPPGDSRQPVAPAIGLPPAYLTTLAGQSGAWGDDDGIGSAARFNWPEGLALSPDDGFALVSDTSNNTIRRVDLGTAQVTTVAGQPGSAGSADGMGAAARFNGPSGIAISPDGSFAVIADAMNHTIRRLTIASGAVTTLAGQAGSGGSADGVGAAARFNSPRAVAVSPDGSFALVADTWNHTVRRIDLTSNAVTTLAGQAGLSGSDDGVGSAATFAAPTGVALTADGSSALVTDGDGNLLRHLDVATGLVTTVAGEPGMFGYFDGAGSAARFNWPMGVALSPNGEWALVADNTAGSVRYVEVASQEVGTLLSLPIHLDGNGRDVRLNWPTGLEVSADGSATLLVDTDSNTVRRLDLASGDVTTVAGDATAWAGSADGIGSAARFRSPRDAALDAAGTVAYIADTGNQTIRRLDLLSGAVTTIAGSPGQTGSANGVGAAARFGWPQAMALSPDETFALIADTDNHTIRRLDLATRQVTTVAGSAGASGSADGVGSAARFNRPQGVAISPDGSYALIADTHNHLIRRLDLATGWVTRVAGWPGWNDSLDGFVDSAYFSYPRGLAISADGSYALVTDSGSGLLRRIGLAGPDANVATTMAGSAWQYREADGIGSAARFYWPVDVALSDDPTFALALDGEAMTVRRVDLPGVGVTPATLLRQEWQMADGTRAADAIALTLPFIDPNLLEDGRARGQLYLEAEVFSRDPTSQPLAGLRNRLASASYPFVVEDAVDGLALFSGQPTYRRNVAGYAPDDDASAVQLAGVLRNTGAGATNVSVLVTRSDGATLLNQTFANVPTDHSRAFRVDDPAPPLGPVSYTASTSLGHSETVSITVAAASVSVQASIAPSSVALGETTIFQLELENTGQTPAFATAHLLAGPLDVQLEPGQAISLTQIMTPTQAGASSLSVALSGDASGPASASVNVRDESAQAEIELVGVLRSTRQAGPADDPQLVQSDDAGLAIRLTNGQPFGFPVLMEYTIAGSPTVTGSQVLTLDPGVAEVVVPLAAASIGAYSASVTVRHGQLGHVLASTTQNFDLVTPIYDLALDATVTPLESSPAVRVDVTGSSAASDLPWNGMLRWRGVVEGEQPLSLAPGSSQSTGVNLDLTDRAGSQNLIVELVNPDGSVLASLTATVQGEPRAAPAAVLDDVTASPAAAGGGLTVAATVSNSGPSGEAVLEVTAFDQVIELIGEVAGAAGLRGPAASTVLSLTVPVPPDLLAGSYPVIVRLGNQERQLNAEITGAEIELRQWLNAGVYQPDALATWTVELEGMAGAPAQYDVELRYGQEAHVQTVTVGAGDTMQVPWTFAVGPVSDRATVLVQTHPLSAEQTRHSLIVDSQWVPVQEDVRAWLETDKDRYHAGETVHLTFHLQTPMQSAMVLEPDGLLGEPGPLVWSSLEVSPTAALTYTITISDPVNGNPVNQTVVLTQTNWIQGDFTFDYTLPAVVSTGRYFFTYFFGSEERTWPIDIFGVNLRVDEFSVTGPGVGSIGRATAGGAVDMAAKLRLDAPVGSARIAAYALGPDEEYLDLGPTAVVTMPLPAGITPVALSGLFTPQRPGAHQIVLKVRDAASLVELGGEAAFVDVGQASISSLLTDQGTYLLGETGTGELTVYGYGPTTLVVTDTVGGMLLNTVDNLNGFARHSFPINTAVVDDYLLVARTVDAAGMVDSALRAYAVPLPPDTESPVLTVTNPSTHTVLYSTAPTMTLTVQGLVSDNRGPVAVYVDGRPASAVVDSGWSAPVTLSQGSNAVSAVALDDAGNFAAAPPVNIIVTPQSGVSHAPDRTSATVGQQLSFQSTLQATGAIDNAQLIQFLPPGRTSSVTAGASRGEVLGIAQGPEGIFIHWKGDVDNAPVTVAVTVTLSSAGVLTSTATAFWGWGLSDQAAAAPIDVNSPLAVTLASFTATQVGGQALLAWETVSEIDHLGFNVYRGGSPDGPWLRINEALIPSPSPGSTAGHVYELLEPLALPPGITWYRLEAVDPQGPAVEVGLISIEPATGDRGLWLPVVVRGAP